MFLICICFICTNAFVRQMAKKKFRSKRRVNFDEKKQEKDDVAPQNVFDNELFKELTKELDVSIDGSMEEAYHDILNMLNKALTGGPCNGSSSRVPTLFLGGHCLDWNWLFNRLRKLHTNLEIKNNKFSNVFEEESSQMGSESEKWQQKDGRKLILFFQNNQSFCEKDVFGQILSLVEENPFILLLVHTPLSFSSIDEQIPRLIFVQIRIIAALHLPSIDKFWATLFDNEKCFCLLPKAKVHFHAKTLAYVRQMFLRECTTLTNVRKALMLALHEYATEYGGQKGPKAGEKREFGTVMEEYHASLRAFALLTDQNAFPSAEEFVFQLHCQIQNGANFASFYTNKKQEWAQWAVDKWHNKMVTIGEIIMDKSHREACGQLISKLDEQRTRRRNEQSENVAPPKKTFATSFKQSAKTAKNFATQRQLLNSLTNPLSADLRVELLHFLDMLFLQNLKPFSVKFVAGPGPLAFLDPSLSSELDRCLTEQSDVISQLDVVIVFRLLVTHSADSYTFQLSSLQEAFCCLAKPIEGLVTEARFLCAITQLEHIGSVKSLSDGFVRLIYLPGAVFQNNPYAKK